MENSGGKERRSGFSERKQEYWGPISQEFTDAYLGVVYDTLKSSYQPVRNSYKKIFSAVNELLHNITDYNLKYFCEDCPPSYFSMELAENSVQLNFKNKILPSSMNGLCSILREGEAKGEEEINEMCRKRILSKESLGLLLIRRRKDFGLKWKLKKSKGSAWLNIFITVPYGKSYY